MEKGKEARCSRRWQSRGWRRARCRRSGPASPRWSRRPPRARQRQQACRGLALQLCRQVGTDVTKDHYLNLPFSYCWGSREVWKGGDQQTTEQGQGSLPEEEGEGEGGGGAAGRRQGGRGEVGSCRAPARGRYGRDADDGEHAGLMGEISC